MHKLTTAALAGALALSGTLALGTSANAATPVPRPAGGTYATTYLVSRACEHEDGSETEICIWDAGRAGIARRHAHAGGVCEGRPCGCAQHGCRLRPVVRAVNPLTRA